MSALEITDKLDSQLDELGKLVFKCDNSSHLDQEVKNYQGVVIGMQVDLWRLYCDCILLQRNEWQSCEDLDFELIKSELDRVAGKISPNFAKQQNKSGNPLPGFQENPERVQCAQQ